MSLPLVPGKKAGSVHHKYCSSKTSKQSMGRGPGVSSLCCSQGLIKCWKRRLENLTLLVYVICVSQSRERHSLQGCHKIPGPPLHLLLAPAKMCMHQPRRKKTTPSKVSLCKWRSLSSLLVFLHSIVQLMVSRPHKEAALLFSWSLSQHIGCNSLLCFCSLVLNRWRTMPPWSSSDTTSVALFHGGLNHMVLCLTGVKKLYDLDQFHPLSHDW